jgi:hypothetical protein
MLAAETSWADLQILGGYYFRQEVLDAVQPDLDSIEYKTDEDLPEWMRGDYEQNTELTMWAQILAGAGISV